MNLENEIKPVNRELTAFVLSDGTGETAELMVKAALVQFQRDHLKVIRYKNIRSESQVVAGCLDGLMG